MKKKIETWQSVTGSFGALAANVAPMLEKVVENAGLKDVTGWQNLILGTGIAPDPLTVERVRQRAIYTAPGKVEDTLGSLQTAGYLDDAFVVTEVAKKGIDALLQGQREGIADVQPVAADKMKTLNGLLKQICTAIDTADESKHPIYDDMRRRPTTNDLIQMEQYVRYMGYLNAYRDDCHIASWQQHPVNGHTWEIFSTLWQGDAKSQADLPDPIVNNRGWTSEETAAAFEQLVDLGWIEAAETDGHYQLTEQGKTIRQEAEDATDQYFFAPWDTLTVDEIESIRNITTQIIDSLKAEQPA